MTVKLAIVSTHPIQYNAPAFRQLGAEPGIELKVFYEWAGSAEVADDEFNRRIEWDIPLLEGYSYEILPNLARRPGTDHFFGINSPVLVQAVGDWKPDVLLVYGWSFISHVRVLRAFHGRVPILFRGDSTLLDHLSPLRSLGRRLVLRWVYGHVDIALFVGAHNRAYYREYGVSDHKLVWAPHAVDNSRFGADHHDREREALQWRAALGIAPDATVFLFAAKLSTRKAPDLMLEAFIQVRAFHPNVPAHLIIVGDGALRESLIKRAGARPDVHFLGFQNQAIMPVVYRLGNVMVLPSRFGETWGLSVNEAMACARGAIVSDQVGCAVDLVESQRNGLRVKANDVPSLVAAMRTVVGDNARLEAWGIQAQRHIRDWSIEAFARITRETALRVASSALMRA